jgi:predicted amidophosphoribosyltransferase
MLATRWAAVDAALAHAPSVCAVCRGWGRGRVCAACLDRFAARTTRCMGCALPLPLPAMVCGACTREPPPFDAAIAAVDYAAPWDRLVTAFKFHDAIDLARPWARAIALAGRARGAPRPGLVVPVARAPTRRRGRG